MFFFFVFSTAVSWSAADSWIFIGISISLETYFVENSLPSKGGHFPYKSESFLQIIDGIPLPLFVVSSIIVECDGDKCELGCKGMTVALVHSPYQINHIQFALLRESVYADFQGNVTLITNAFYSSVFEIIREIKSRTFTKSQLLDNAWVCAAIIRLRFPGISYFHEQIWTIYKQISIFKSIEIMHVWPKDDIIARRSGGQGRIYYIYGGRKTSRNIVHFLNNLF